MKQGGARSFYLKNTDDRCDHARLGNLKKETGYAVAGLRKILSLLTVKEISGEPPWQERFEEWSLMSHRFQGVEEENGGEVGSPPACRTVRFSLKGGAARSSRIAT